MRRVLRTLVAASVGAIVFVPMTPAHATTERIPFACEEYLVSLDLSGAREWEAGNVPHGRNGTAILRPEGEAENLGEFCEGRDIVVGNHNWFWTFWGTFRLELDAYPDSGFEGTWHELYPRGEGVGQGYGVLEGWQMRLWVQELDPESPSDPISRIWGYVFNPRG